MNGLERIKRGGIFLLILILLGACVTMVALDTVTECVSILRAGVGSEEYFLLGTDNANNIYALGRRNGEYFVVQGSENGKRGKTVKIPSAALPESSVPAAFYPLNDGTFYLGLYDTGVEPLSLKLFRVSPNGKDVDMLYSEPGLGDTFAEQKASIKLTNFTANEETVNFAVLSGDNAHFYRTDGAGGLEDMGIESEPGLRLAMALPNGTRVLITDGGIKVDGTEAVRFTLGEKVMRIYEDGIRAYCVEGAGLNVFYANFSDWIPYSYLTLEKSRYNIDDCTDLTVNGNGNVILLLNGNRLVLDRGTVVTDITSMLHRSGAVCVLILAGLAVGTLVVSAILWYFCCVQRRSRLPLLLRWGALFITVTLLLTLGALRFVVPAYAEADAERETLEMIDAAVRLKYENGGIDDLSAQAARALAESGGGLFRDVSSAELNVDAGMWFIEESFFGAPRGSRGELLPGFDAEMAREAELNGSSFRLVRRGESSRFLYCRFIEGRLLQVDVDAEGILAECRGSARWIDTCLIATSAVLLLLTLIALAVITKKLRKLLKGIESINRGERNVSVEIGGGDELTSLGNDLAAMSRQITSREAEHRRLEEAYRRFVPERVLSLLGKNSIAEVDKSTFAVGNLAAMRFTFKFPRETYERSGRELFDNVNEVIERTSSIVYSRGGAVFNFAYDGYNAVFEEGSAAAVSAAVAIQQEILEINREREAEERPRVYARITLDEGPVVFGVVGDEHQIEPASISVPFSSDRKLMELCARLDATVLCTESVVSKAEGYNNRYIGRCSAGSSVIRTYEIFDGDPYESRKFKEQTRDTFAEGIFAFYARDYARAKGIFLSLVRRSNTDGCARYYLYLSEKMEKDDRSEPGLDLGL